MSNYEFIKRIEELLEPICVREGCQLYDLEWLGQQRVLRVYIDRSEGHVSIDDCSNVSRALNLILDVEDIIPGAAYELEVSSPGLERRLTRQWHFQKVVGKRVRVRLSQALPSTDAPGPKNLEGVLQEVSNDNFVIQSKHQAWQVPMALVVSGQVVFTAPETSRPGKNKKR